MKYFLKSLIKWLVIAIIINAIIALFIMYYAWIYSLSYDPVVVLAAGLLFTLQLWINIYIISACAIVYAIRKMSVRMRIFLFCSLLIIIVAWYPVSIEYKSSKAKKCIESYPLSEYGVLPDDSYPCEPIFTSCGRYNKERFAKPLRFPLSDDDIKMLRRIAPIYPDALTSLADNYYNTGNYRQAIAVYDEMRRTGHSRNNNFYKLHEIYLLGNIFRSDEIKLHEAEMFGFAISCTDEWCVNYRKNMKETIANFPSSYKEALKNYHVAAILGNTEAQSKLGDIYAQYYSVDDAFKIIQLQYAKEHKADFQEAIKWYNLAAKNGDVHSQLMLADYYYNGSHVPKNYQLAFKWYLLAATQGSVQAQERLGDFYYYGINVPKSNSEALKWYIFAAREQIRAMCFLPYDSHAGAMIKKIYNEK